MRIRDEYLHGSDLTGVVKKIEVTIGNGNNANQSVIKYTKADSEGGVVEVPIGDITGKAATASKLDNTSAIGSTTNPVYFTANGVPSACTYSLNATVPAGAANQVLYYSATNTLGTQSYTTLTSNLDVFTAATSSAAGKKGLVPAPAANQLGAGNFFLRADGAWTVIESKSAALNGTATSLVTTGEKYNWNSAYNWYNSMTSGDTDGVINKWKEVEAFLANYGDSSTLAAELAKLVTLSTDQTITGVKTFSEVINGSITGNADTVDNLHASDFARSRGVGLLPTDINHLGYGYAKNGWYENGPAFTFGIGSEYARIQKYYNNNSLYLGGYSSKSGELGWREFAFTDSNVASATYATSAGNAEHATSADTARDATLHNGYTIVQTNGLTSTIRDFTLGTLVRTSIDYSVTNGDPFYVEIKGNTYRDAPNSCFTQIQGYIYEDTIIAYGVTHLGVLKITPITAMNIDGKLCFWFPYLGYWMGFDIRCYTGRNYAINTVISIEDSADPGGTKRVTLTENEITSYHSGNLTSSVIGNLGTLSNNISGNADTSSKLFSTTVHPFNSTVFTYRKFASINITSKYSGLSALLLLTYSISTSNKYGNSCNVYINAYQQDELGNPPRYNIETDCDDRYFNIYAVLNYTSTASTIDLYVYGKERSYSSINVSLLSGYNIIDIGDALSSLPSGTVINPTKYGSVYSASKWTTARKITLTGSITGEASIDGSGDVTLATTTNHTHNDYVTDLGTNGNYLTWTKNGSTSTITVPYASSAGYSEYALSLDSISLPNSVTNARNTVWCKFATITINESIYCNVSGYIFFSGEQHLDYKGILEYHFRSGNPATVLDIGQLSWLVKSHDYMSVIAVKTADSVYDFYINNCSTWSTTRIYHFSTFNKRFKWNVGSWTTTKPTAAITASDIGRVYYSTNAGDADTLDGIDSTGFLRKVTIPNNTENDFDTFETMTLTGRGDPTTGASLKNAPWTGVGPAGGYGVLTYLWSSYGIQMACGYNSNRIYIRCNHYNGSLTLWKTTWDSIALTSDIPTKVSQLTNDAKYLTSHAYSYGSIDIYDINGAKKTSNNTVSASVNTETLRLQEGDNITITATNSGTSGSDNIKIAVTGITSNIDRNGYGQLALWYNGASEVSTTLQSATFNELLTVKAGSGIDFNGLNKTANDDVWTISAIPYNCAITLNANSAKSLIKDSWSADSLSVYLTSNGTSGGTSLAAGTYALWIEDRSTNSGTPNYYSGTFTCAGSATAGRLDEIALHSSMATNADTNAPTRIFVATQISGTSRKHVLRFCSLDSKATPHYLTVKVNRII